MKSFVIICKVKELPALPAVKEADEHQLSTETKADMNYELLEEKYF